MNVHDLLEWLSDQLNLTTMIAVAGFAMSLFTGIHSLLSHRRNISARILAFDVFGSRMILTMSFENRSQLPIAITNVNYVVEKTSLKCRFRKEKIKSSCAATPTLVCEKAQYKGGPVVAKSQVYSNAMPIQLNSLGAVSCIVVFGKLPVPPQKGARNLSLEICTNRGKPIRKTLELCEGVPSHCKL